MLEYDNSAFYYFALTLLGIYVIPGTWYALAEFFRAFFGSGDVGTKARSKSETQKASQLKKQTTGWARLNNSTYIGNLVGLLAAWTLIIYLINLVSSEGIVKSFDPYSILGIEQGVALSEIKKAYRRLSLKYHPDKNIGDKLAEEMFMKIAKAYEALTDETSKENYEKYGNPDGKQALEVSIGLPKILLDNPKIVLVLYLIGMVVIIPSVVGIWYSNSKQYGEKNILYETYNAFYQLLQHTHRLKNLPEILAASGEYRRINVPKPTDQEVLAVVYERMKKDKVMVKPKFEVPQLLRGNLLLHAHLARATDLLTPDLKADLQAMLLKTPDLIEGLVEIASHRKWFDTSLSAIRLSQCIVQAIWYPLNIAESFAQLPYLSSLSDADYKKLKNLAFPSAFKGVRSLGEFVKLARGEQEKALTALDRLTAEEVQEVLQVVQVVPSVSISTKLFVEEEEEDSTTNTTAVVPPAVRGDMVLQQDLVTLQVTFTRHHIAPNQPLPPVHAPFFPGTVFETWWLVLMDKPDTTVQGAGGPPREPVIHAFEKITNPSQSFTHEIKFMAPGELGRHQYTLQLVSDCYLGLDQEIAVEMEVHSVDLLPEYAPHPEDQELDNEPTLFEQVMAANLDEESSDEEDEGEEEAEGQGAVAVAVVGSKKGPKGVQGKGKKAAVVVEDVSDEE